MADIILTKEDFREHTDMEGFWYQCPECFYEYIQGEFAKFCGGCGIPVKLDDEEKKKINTGY